MDDLIFWPERDNRLCTRQTFSFQSAVMEVLAHFSRYVVIIFDNYERGLFVRIFVIMNAFGLQVNPLYSSAAPRRLNFIYYSLCHLFQVLLFHEFLITTL